MNRLKDCLLFWVHCYGLQFQLKIEVKLMKKIMWLQGIEIMSQNGETVNRELSCSVDPIFG